MAELTEPSPSPMYEALVEVSEGNPGAVTVVIGLMGHRAIIDYLRAYGPRGSALWTLYNDDCYEDLALVRSTLGARLNSSRDADRDT